MRACGNHRPGLQPAQTRRHMQVQPAAEHLRACRFCSQYLPTPFFSPPRLSPLSTDSYSFGDVSAITGNLFWHHNTTPPTPLPDIAFRRLAILDIP
jgi:hypothetical protein